MSGWLIAGMNRYRAWIDRRELHQALACMLLPLLIMGTLETLAYVPFFGWAWYTTLAVAAIPVEVYLGVAQMTQWRWDGR
jgi:hypothetical protein